MLTITTKSQNTVDAFKFLERNQGQFFTIKQVAEALGLTSAQVTGGLTSLVKKEVLTKTDLTVDGKTYKGYSYAAPAEFVFEAPKNMSDKAVQVLQFLQANATSDLTAADIAEHMQVQPIAVNGVVNGLVKKGYVVRVESTVEMPEGGTKTIKFVNLTEEGKSYEF